MAGFWPCTLRFVTKGVGIVWADNETDRDYLNFSSVSDTVAEIIVQAQGRPISIGVSGAWGSGKSSMIKLIQTSLSSRVVGPGESGFVFVEFNAWLYQGYDDARAALMEVIATKLQETAIERETAVEKVQALLQRVNWLRAAKLLAGHAAAISMGLPPVGLIGQLWGIGRRALDGGIDDSLLGEGQQALSETGDAASRLLKPTEEASSPPKEIQALRDDFELTLKELGVTLVLLVDDLDRCLPETTISTLEAIRLFLFLQNTAFVIAADTDVIKLAVRRHFADGGIDHDNRLVTSYFDKLVQVPIQVPPLGIQEVRAYMMLLFVETSSIEDKRMERIREGVCSQLRQTWQGKRVDKAFVSALDKDLPPEVAARFDTADRLAPLMIQASGIICNPRLIKRFLNALSLRSAIARTQGVAVDETVLAKLLLLERHGGPTAFAELTRRVGMSATGKPEFLTDWENQAIAGKIPEVEEQFNSSFFVDWLALPPPLGNNDLRGALYVSREHILPITAEDRLSSEGSELLTALLEHPREAFSLKERLVGVLPAEREVIHGPTHGPGAPGRRLGCPRHTRSVPGVGRRRSGAKQ